MRGELIDVWDVKTFDAKLTAELEKAAPLIQSYFKTEKSILLAYDLASGPNRRLRRPRNPDAAEFSALETETGTLMRSRIIRAWHYTRLADAEVDDLTRDGVCLSTLESFRGRLDARVAAGDLNLEQAEELYRASRIHSERGMREKKFWMTSHPEPVDDPGVRELLGQWGGEVAYAGLENGTLLDHLQTIGKPRVLEIAVPLARTGWAPCAGRAVIAAFSHALGCRSESRKFDLSVEVPLGPAAVLRVQSKGDDSFDSLGRNWPEGFVNVDQ